MNLENIKDDFEWNGEVVKIKDFEEGFRKILDKAGISSEYNFHFYFVEKDNKHFIKLSSKNGIDSGKAYELFRNKILLNEKVFEDYLKFLSDYNLALIR